VSRIPRLLPLVAVAIGGVLAVKAITEAPQLYLASRALAEDVVTKGPIKSALPPDASILSGASQSSAKVAAPACAPTAAELAKEAGLSPAELQVLQSLSDRRGQLDQRESSLDTQVQLIAAAEAKLDSRIAQMNGLKTDIQALLGQADQQTQAEADRLVRVYEDMDAKKAAAAMAILDDSVRLPIAAKMKERKLADILKNMAPQDAKVLTEKLAARTAGSKLIADAKTALNPSAAPAPAPAQATASPTPKPAAPAPGQDAQIGQTDGSADAATAAAPAKPHKVARAAPKPRPKPKPTPVDPAVADAMHPPGGVVMPAAKPSPKVAVGPAPAKPAPKAPAKVAAAGPAAAPAAKPVAPPLPPSAKPG
jgi:flagellar motility protein MotE (MotC chaperone)